MPHCIESTNKILADFEDACRNSGLKLTHQRIEIFRELLAATDHPTAEALYVRLRTKLPTISLDTVYRTLNTLADKGLINRVETFESLARFEAIHVRHHHLICRKCGQIIDFIWPGIDEAEFSDEIKNWGRIDSMNLVVNGVCTACLKK